METSRVFRFLERHTGVERHLTYELTPDAYRFCVENIDAEDWFDWMDSRVWPEPDTGGLVRVFGGPDYYADTQARLMDASNLEALKCELEGVRDSDVAVDWIIHDWLEIVPGTLPWVMVGQFLRFLEDEYPLLDDEGYYQRVDNELYKVAEQFVAEFDEGNTRDRESVPEGFLELDDESRVEVIFMAAREGFSQYGEIGYWKPDDMNVAWSEFMSAKAEGL